MDDGWKGATAPTEHVELPPVGQRLARPIFVGGMSRSGTTVMGKGLLNRHPTISVTRPAEMWFITNTGGLCDVVDAAEAGGFSARLMVNTLRRGKVSPLTAFRERMEGFWYARDWWKDGRNIGLGKAVSRQQLGDALDRFEADFPRGPRDAGRQLAADLIDPTTIRRGKQRWVDTTPDNVARADALHRMFPDLVVINMIRDGRDVAASVVSRGWGTDDHGKALKQWGSRMLEGHRALQALPPRQVLTIQLEHLVGPDGEQDYERLLAALGIDDDPKMRDFFRTQMTTEASNSGRWRRDLSAREQASIDRQYERICERLRREGVTLPN